MRRIQALFQNLLHEESGLDLIEYAVIGVSTVAALVVFAHSLHSMINEGF